MSLLDDIKEQPDLFEALEKFRLMLSGRYSKDRSEVIKIPRSHKVSVHDMKHHRMPHSVKHNILFVPGIDNRTEYSFIIIGKILGMGFSSAVFEAEVYPPVAANPFFVLKMLITKLFGHVRGDISKERYTSRRIHAKRANHQLQIVPSVMIQEEYEVLKNLGKAFGRFSRSITKLMWCHNAFEYVDIEKEYILEVREPGIDLMDYLQEPQSKTDASLIRYDLLSGLDILALCRAVLESITSLHHKGWVHTDIKLDNMIVEVLNPKDVSIPIVMGARFAYQVQLVDFACAVPVSPNTFEHKSKISCTTMEYKAPELEMQGKLVTGFTTQSDMYAIGICLHRLFSPKISEPYRTGVNQLISNLMSVQPDVRYDCDKALAVFDEFCPLQKAQRQADISPTILDKPAILPRFTMQSLAEQNKIDMRKGLKILTEIVSPP